MPLLPPNVSYRPDNTPLFSTSGGGGGVTSVVAGSQITVDNTNPSAPVVNWALGVGDGLEVTAGAAPNLAVNLAAGAGITLTPPAAPGDPITIAATATNIGGWTTFFNETVAPLELEEAANTAIFTIALPPALQNATKYTVRVMDINIPVIQGSTLDRALVYFDYNITRNGISYVGGGAGQTSGCDNNFIWLGNGTGGTGGKLQSGTSFTNPSSGALNAPIAPFSNNAFFADAGASPTASLASLNLPVFNIFNYNGDTGITNLYCVFNPDPNDGTQAVGQMGAGARLRCIVEASFEPKY
jgi:hypothetical protein